MQYNFIADLILKGLNAIKAKNAKLFLGVVFILAMLKWFITSEFFVEVFGGTIPPSVSTAGDWILFLAALATQVHTKEYVEAQKKK